MDEYARGFAKAVDNFKAIIEGRLKAYDGEYKNADRMSVLEDILHNDIPAQERLAKSLDMNAYNDRVVRIVESVAGLRR